MSDLIKRLQEAEGGSRVRLNETAPACSECDGFGLYTTGREIYPHRPDLYGKGFYRCTCGAFVGCHPGTKNALGTPAGAKTRNARKAAHSAFDPLWKGGTMKRSAAYKALAAELGISAGDCHMSWFGADRCLEVVAAVARIQTARAALQSQEPTP